jgi:hypothetical protein
MINYRQQIILKQAKKKLILVFHPFNEDMLNKKVKEYLNNFLKVTTLKKSYKLSKVMKQ